MSETTTNITRVGTVVVPVSDQDRALEFYVGKLGFETRIDGPFGEGQRWIEVAPPGATTTIALVSSQDGIEVSWRLRTPTPTMRISVSVGSRPTRR